MLASVFSKSARFRFRKTFGAFFALVMAALVYTGCSGPLDPNTSKPIGSQADLAKIGADSDYPWNGSYGLTSDIELENWIPIGDETSYFSGSFDGGGYTITLKSFDSAAVSQKQYLGIFGYIKGASDTAKASVKNLNIYSSVNADSSASTDQYIGSLAGIAENAELSGITLSGSLSFSSQQILFLGGIAGSIQAGALIKNCTGSMTLDIKPGAKDGANYSYIGGFAGIFKNGGGISDCRNSGSVSAVSEVSGSQVFAGGIAGGSTYGFSTAYQGFIEDSSSTGNITAKAKGYWTFAGGIAGTIVGDGDGSFENTTRIVRCRADGTVSTAETGSGWPYVGGIVGYNYYGALVSQSCFTGTVIADNGSDYTGGIAGYNSQTTGHNSRIEDCWSSGTVQGFNNAGGIVGQNQVNTYIRRCYSRAAVETTNGSGIGGIAGLNASGQEDAITACVALNASITAAKGNNIHRIVGSGAGTLSRNYARSGLLPATTAGTYTADEGSDKPDGADCEEKPGETFYTNLGWDFDTVWVMGADGYPALRWTL
ncbi:MAG: hypothetical protein LBP74_06255 [Treponema sp.]|jgi:hypothetical protein|nr:hypothetical protein [Treponema sp.]